MQPDTKLKSLKDYEEYTHAWMPADSILSIVRVPAGYQQLTWSEYKDLMRLRVEWMIQQAISEDNFEIHDIQTELTNTARALGMSEFPTLTDWDSEELTVWQWSFDWATHLVEINPTWEELVRQSWDVPEIPNCQSTTYPLQPDLELCETHDTDRRLSEWLTQLT